MYTFKCIYIYIYYLYIRMHISFFCILSKLIAVIAEAVPLGIDGIVEIRVLAELLQELLLLEMSFESTHHLQQSPRPLLVLRVLVLLEFSNVLIHHPPDLRAILGVLRVERLAPVGRIPQPFEDLLNLCGPIGVRRDFSHLGGRNDVLTF